MSKQGHARKAAFGRAWRASCSAVPLLVIIATLFVVPPVAIAQEAPFAGASGAPTIVSDQDDYLPGSLVTLTGSDWAEGESVHIVVNDTVGQTWTYVADVTAQADGTFTHSFNLPNYFVSDYDVTATGPVSGTATTTFTDAPLKIVGKQHEGQVSPAGTYTSGNITTYSEGDFINFHFTVESNDATSGPDPSTGGVEVRYTGDDGTCLFFDGSFGLGATDIPTISGDQTLAGVVSVTGSVPTVTTIGSPVQQNAGTSSGEWVQLLEIHFDDAGTAVINYHIRLSDEAGECNGSSQHSRLAEPATNAGDFTQTGAQNVPVPANQVIELPDITVIKKIDRDGDGSFEDVADEGEYRFCLDPSTTNTCLETDGSGQVVFTNVTPNGAHTITEEQVDFTNGTYAFDSGSGTNCTFNGSIATATVASGTTATDASCTFNNKANKGSIELVKSWSGTPGQTTLNIGTTKGDDDVATQLTGADGAAPLTTGAYQVIAGTYFVSETGGLAGYSSSLACFNDIGGGTGGVANDGIKNGTEPTVTPDGDNGVQVNSNDDVVCTFTNSRDTGQIKVIKDFSDNSPAGAKVDLQIDGTTKLANAEDGDDTGFVTVNTGNHSVGELEVDGTDLSDYTTSISCVDDEDTVVASNSDSLSLGDIPVGKGDQITCTITNSRHQGAIELVKVWSGTPGQTTLDIGTTKGDDDVDTQLTGANGADPLTTDENTVNTGTYYVSETGGLTGYTSSLACFNDNGAGEDGEAGNGIQNGDEPNVTPDSDGGVEVTTGDDIVCTFANTRDRGQIELRKVWVGIAGQTTLQIGTTANDDDIDFQQTGANGAPPLTTGPNDVDTGTYYISEVGGLAGYSTSVACFNDIGGGSGGVAHDGIKNGTELSVSVSSSGAVNVGKDADVVCTFTNTKFIHPGTIGFWRNWRNHYSTGQMNTIISYIIAHNPTVYATPDLTIAIYDAIFNYGKGNPKVEQQILGQLTGLKSNLAVSALDPNPPQLNDDICTSGVVNVSGISGATAYFGTSTPTIGQVVTAIESKWTGTLGTNKAQWSFSLTNAQKTMFIAVLSGINEGTIIVSPC
jgi:prealbumin domain-containing protein